MSESTTQRTWLETYYSIVCILNGFEDKLSPLLEKQAQKNRMAKLCKIDITK